MKVLAVELPMDRTYYDILDHGLQATYTGLTIDIIVIEINGKAQLPYILKIPYIN